MAVKWKTERNRLPEVEQTLKSMKSKKVKVGAFKGDHAWLAGIHEYGIDIEVTPKMRAYLHGQGLHLKDTTTHIKIPERAFLRNGHDENIDRIIKQTERAISQVVAGKMPEEKLYDLFGQQMTSAIKKYMGETEPNHPFTIEQKGSSTPLVGRSKGLRNSITWEVEG